MNKTVYSLIFMWSMLTACLFYIRCAQLDLSQEPGPRSGDRSDGNSRGPEDYENRRIDPDDDDGGEWGHDTSLNRRCTYLRECDLDGDGDRYQDTESVREQYDQLEDRVGGGSASLDIDPDMMEEYRLGASSNYEITKGRVFLDMERVSGEKYYEGKVVVAYELKKDDNTREVKSWEFHSGSGKDAVNNIWANFRNDGKFGFHGFFTDGRSGAVIVVLDEPEDALRSSDGDRAEVRSSDGSVWFMNFRKWNARDKKRDCNENGCFLGLSNCIGPPPPQKMCWFIKNFGPYDCRAFADDKHSVDSLRNLEPRGSCYKKLGEFENLNIEKVFDLDEGEDLWVASDGYDED